MDGPRPTPPTLAQLQAENALLKRALAMLVRSLEDSADATDVEHARATADVPKTPTR